MKQTHARLSFGLGLLALCLFSSCATESKTTIDVVYLITSTPIVVVTQMSTPALVSAPTIPAHSPVVSTTRPQPPNTPMKTPTQTLPPVATLISPPVSKTPVQSSTSVPVSQPTSKKVAPTGTAVIYDPSTGAVLWGWKNVRGIASCGDTQIDYYKFELDGHAFVAKFQKGDFPGDLLMRWDTSSIGNNSYILYLQVVCKDGRLITSTGVRVVIRN